MKKLLILVLSMVLLLSACGNKSEDGSHSSKKNNSSSSKADTSESSSDDESDDLSDSSVDDSWYDDFGELTVSAEVKPAVVNEILPPVNSADLANPAVLGFAGAKDEALAMRQRIVNSTDNVSVSGTIYYVTPNGNDDNNGKSVSAPFETVTHAISVAKSGDAVLLERGKVFRLSNGVTLTSGVTYGAYGTGPKPEIWGSLENYAQPARWNPFTMRNVWMIDFSRSDVGIIVFNHGELVGDMKYYVRNLTENGDYFFDDVQKILYVYCDKGNPGTVFSDIEIGVRTILFRLRDGAKNVKIDNLSFKYTGTFGIRGSKGCRNISITNCMVGWCGGSIFDDGSNRYGNGIEFTAGCQDVTVENCWIYQIYDAGLTFQITTDSEGADSYTYNNLNFNNNLIEYCSWAFEWWPSDKNCKISNISVKNNIMRFSGYGWAADTRSPSHIRGSWIGIDFAPENFVISNNIFDCSNGPVYAWPWFSQVQTGHLMTGNSYYQRKPASTANSVFNIGYGEARIYASNQQELEAAVKTVDSAPTTVKWLG